MPDENGLPTKDEAMLEAIKEDIRNASKPVGVRVSMMWMGYLFLVLIAPLGLTLKVVAENIPTYTEANKHLLDTLWS